MGDVAFLVGKAYPDLDATVFLTYFGEFSNYPHGFDTWTIIRNPTRGWSIRPVLMYWQGWANGTHVDRLSEAESPGRALAGRPPDRAPLAAVFRRRTCARSRGGSTHESD